MKETGLNITLALRNRVRTVAIVSALTLGLSQVAWSASVKEGLAALDAKDYEVAAQQFAEAYEKGGEPDGAFYLGRLFELGVGTQPDIIRAAGLYRLAAEKGSALGQNRLAMLYIRGEAGVLQDYKAANEWLAKAASAGNADAQFNYAVMYEKGWGVAVDNKKSLEWYRKAAKQNHIGAANKLGLAYRDGTGVKASQQEAISWFTRSASQGNALGLYEVALAFANGEGRKENAGKAYLLSNLAAAGGHPQAASLRDQVARSLDTKALNNYQSQARSWSELSEKQRMDLLS